MHTYHPCDICLTTQRHTHSHTIWRTLTYRGTYIVHTQIHTEQAYHFHTSLRYVHVHMSEGTHTYYTHTCIHTHTHTHKDKRKRMRIRMYPNQNFAYKHQNRLLYKCIQYNTHRSTSSSVSFSSSHGSLYPWIHTKTQRVAFGLSFFSHPKTGYLQWGVVRPTSVSAVGARLDKKPANFWLASCKSINLRPT